MLMFNFVMRKLGVREIGMMEYWNGHGHKKAKRE